MRSDAFNDWQLRAVFYKVAYQQFVTEAAHGGNYKRRGKWSRCGAGSTGLEGHVCEFTASSPVAWVVGAAPHPSPHREQGGPGGLQLWMQGRERQ